MAGDGTGWTRRQENGPASGVLTRGRLGCDAQVNSDDGSKPGAETEVRRRGMGIKISPQRGAERLPTKKGSRPLGAPQSSFLVRYLSASMLPRVKPEGKL